MTLRTEIEELQLRVVEQLDKAHDYYADTQAAWKVLDAEIKKGLKFEFRNASTGSITDESALAAKIRGYVREQLAEASFQQFISIFENFLLEFLSRWLRSHPLILSEKQLKLRIVIEALDLQEVIQAAINRELHELFYKKPAEWFKDLVDFTKIPPIDQSDVDRIVEAKATRDILVHNQGVVNKTYEAKSGPLTRFNIGERLDIPDDYHQEVWELLKSTVEKICRSALTKVP